MAIRLEKGQRINLEKTSGAKLSNFCVGCNWGAIETRSGLFGLGKKVVSVDLDLSCVMLNARGELYDHIYSPLYRVDLLKKFGLPAGKLDSFDRALHHSGDDLQGDTGGDDGLDNEIITVNLTKLSLEIEQIFFFLNNVGKEDFSQIPYASIRMYEGSPTKVQTVFAQYDIAAEPKYAGKKALIMGKLYKHEGDWKFAAIGDAFEDNFLAYTIIRIVNDYAKK